MAVVERQQRGSRRSGALSLFMAVCAVGCARDQTVSPAVAAPERGVVVLETSGQTVRVQAEVVRTPEARARGLMGRKTLAPYAGMLFIFEAEEPQSFWMKNTYLPLDIIFIDEQQRVVGIVANAQPLSTASRRVEAPSRYVLEVNGGFCRTHGIGEGTRVIFENIPLK